jgi:hypothetical protein
LFLLWWLTWDGVLAGRGWTGTDGRGGGAGERGGQGKLSSCVLQPLAQFQCILFPRATNAQWQTSGKLVANSVANSVANPVANLSVVVKRIFVRVAFYYNLENKGFIRKRANENAFYHNTEVCHWVCH